MNLIKLLLLGQGLALEAPKATLGHEWQENLLLDVSPDTFKVVN